jgi:quinol-cytochrome oxidoreductase complex cytochrome b subunit
MVNSFFLHIHPVKVKLSSLRISYSLGLGVISTVLFVILVITGVWLMFYYSPSVERAYTDIQNIQTSVTFGALMRNMHRWAAHLMVLTVFLHMCRVFLTGGYKSPREFNWAIGVTLWIVTLMLSFTGYLLPWDQLAYWAITVSTNIAATIPFFGENIRQFMLGGVETGAESLVRFYAMHIAVLPIIMTLLIAVHFWRIRKDGGLSSPTESIEQRSMEESQTS